MSERAEWQPARYRRIHLAGKHPESGEWCKKRVIRIRKWEDPNPNQEGINERGGDCGAAEYFELHPDDAASAYGCDPGKTIVICEHEILTD